MQIVCIADTLHEMSNPVSWEKQNILKCLLLKFLPSMQTVNCCFLFRWILLCFKREFNEKEALRIWEACWSHYQTDYFHLFICVAIVSVYGEDVIEQCLPADEILLHFSSLACHMSGELVLRKVCHMNGELVT